MKTNEDAANFTLSDALWAQIAPLIPPASARKTAGRPRMDDRRMLTAILYVLWTGCSWRALPRSLGAPSTVHDRFQEWRAAGFFDHLERAGLLEYEEAQRAAGNEWELVARPKRRKDRWGARRRRKSNVDRSLTP